MRHFYAAREYLYQHVKISKGSFNNAILKELFPPGACAVHCQTRKRSWIVEVLITIRFHGRCFGLRFSIKFLRKTICFCTEISWRKTSEGSPPILEYFHFFVYHQPGFKLIEVFKFHSVSPLDKSGTAICKHSICRT